MDCMALLQCLATEDKGTIDAFIFQIRFNKAHPEHKLGGNKRRLPAKNAVLRFFYILAFTNPS